MSTAADSNGQRANGRVPTPEPGGPLVLGGLAIAGSPLDLAELERLANEIFRAGPEGAGLGADTSAPPQTGVEDAVSQIPGIDGLSPEPALDGSPAAQEVLQWASLADGARPTTPGVVPAVAPDSRVTPWVDAATAGVPSAGARAQHAPKSAGVDLFALHNRPLPLGELSLAQQRRVSATEPVDGSYYVIKEADAFARALDAGNPATLPTHPTSATAVHPAFDIDAVRADFPVLGEHVHGRPLIWLDNAATTQKPAAVIDRLDYFYRHENSNVHRGAHELAARATDAYETARDTVADFLHAGSSDEIVFVRGATEAINLVAQAWGRDNLRAGDEIVITWLEHHANIVPWQQLCQETGARLRVVPVDDSGQVILDAYERLLGPATRLVAFAHVANALGTVLPAREMVATAHRYGARVLIDGAQAVSHMPVDVQDLDCDWYAFSGHKVFGPTGIGVLYGKADLLNAMAPWQGGGNMIKDVTFEKTVYQPAPVRFEAGTPSIADAVGLGAALDYLQQIGIENVHRYEQDLLAYATNGLLTVPGLHLIGTAPDKASVLSFVLDGLPAEDVGKALDREGIAVRAGHHCAQPIIRRFGHESTVRASLALYNTPADVDALVAALHTIAARAAQP
ncbi:MAG: family 2A encapsulin nanocompartment cargo protein cysteine desulfurase [Solirubrobacteraceae bacterium]